MSVDLTKINLPQTILDLASQPLPNDLQKNLSAIKDDLLNTKVVFVCGVESDTKDAVFGKLAIAHARKGKKVKFYSTFEMEQLYFQLSAFVNVLHSADHVSKRAAENLRSQMIERLLRGGKLIIGCYDVKTFSDVYGDSLVSYFSPMSISITISQKRSPIKNYEL